MTTAVWAKGKLHYLSGIYTNKSLAINAGLKAIKRKRASSFKVIPRYKRYELYVAK